MNVFFLKQPMFFYNFFQAILCLVGDTQNALQAKNAPPLLTITLRAPKGHCFNGWQKYFYGYSVWRFMPLKSTNSDELQNVKNRNWSRSKKFIARMSLIAFCAGAWLYSHPRFYLSYFDLLFSKFDSRGQESLKECLDKDMLIENEIAICPNLSANDYRKLCDKKTDTADVVRENENQHRLKQLLDYFEPADTDFQTLDHQQKQELVEKFNQAFERSPINYLILFKQTSSEAQALLDEELELVSNEEKILQCHEVISGALKTAQLFTMCPYLLQSDGARDPSLGLNYFPDLLQRGPGKSKFYENEEDLLAEAKIQWDQFRTHSEDFHQVIGLIFLGEKLGEVDQELQSRYFRELIELACEKSGAVELTSSYWSINNLLDAGVYMRSLPFINYPNNIPYDYFEKEDIAQELFFYFEVHFDVLDDVRKEVPGIARENCIKKIENEVHQQLQDIDRILKICPSLFCPEFSAKRDRIEEFGQKIREVVEGIKDISDRMLNLKE